MAHRTTQITLIGSTDWHESYPPRDAKKGYVAKITGRVPGPRKYEREFLGDEVTLVEGDEGLYEVQVGAKKGGALRRYYVVLSHPEHGLIISSDCEGEVARIVKLLDAGIAIQDAVEIVDLREHPRDETRMQFTARARTAAQAKRAATGATLDSAIESCWQVLSLLPEREQKKVLAELRKRVTPPKAAPADAPQEDATDQPASE